MRKELLEDKSKLYGFLVFIITFAYLSIWIWQGIDFTDTGMNLTKQWLVVNGKAVDYLDMLFGSYFIGGLWNSIIGGNYLLWAYFGSVLIGSFSALVVYLIVKDYCNKKYSFLSVLIIIPLLFVPLIKVPNYNDIPTLLFLLMVLLISKSTINESPKISNILLVFSGVIYSIALVSRLMLLVLLIFPLVLIIYNIFNRNNKLEWFKKSLYFTSGLLAGIMILFFFLNYFGLLKIYLSNIFINIYEGLIKNIPENVPLTPVHSLEKTFMNTIRYFYYPLLLIPMSILVLSVTSNVLKIKKILLRNSIITFLAILFTFLIYKYLSVFGYYNYIYYLLFGFNFLIICIYLFKSDKNKQTLIILLILFSQIVINFGSNVMNWTSMYLSTALSIALMFKLSKFSFNQRLKWFRFISLKKLIIIILVLLGITSNFFNIYRDSPNRFELANNFNTENLSFIYSTEDRVAAIDGLIEELNKYIEPKDEVLYINNIPLLYYLTKTIPVSKEPWILNLYTDEAFNKEVEMIFKKQLPEIVVVAKGSIRRDRNWPENVNSIGVHERNINKLLFLYNALNENNYKTIWENEGFELYRQS